MAIEYPKVDAKEKSFAKLETNISIFQVFREFSKFLYHLISGSSFKKELKFVCLP